jgi:cytochrome oxidase Cu insertion factor (SCO1/SenC/PrrC family)
MKRLMLLLIVQATFATVANGGQPLINTQAPAFSLRDQFDRRYSLQSFSGQPFIMIASDKKGSWQNKQWIEGIRGRFRDKLPIVGVADVRKVPFFMKSSIRNDFKKDREIILLDWDGSLFTSYDLMQNAANVILIDGQGYVRHLQAGSASPESLERLFKEIDIRVNGKQGE